MKKILILPFVVLGLFGLFGCGSNTKESINNDLCILFTNDVHCSYDENIGYTGLKTIKNDALKHYKNVLLVDSGDFTQGSAIASVSKGKSSLEIVNEVGYDYSIIGNHEFDYGLTTLSETISGFNGKIIASNLSYTGKRSDPFKDAIKYDIKNYGSYKVGFIGISTPISVSQSTPANFKEDGEFVVSFGKSATSDEFADTVQDIVDNVRKAGATIVVALTHLGDIDPVDKGEYMYSSNLISTLTSGIDIFLDGHSHTVIPGNTVRNKVGKNIIVCQTGTGLTNVGKLVINKDGIKSLNLIQSEKIKDPTVSKKIEEVKDKYGKELKKVVAHSDYDLSITDDEGIRMVRSRETNIGNFVADAYRHATGADIGMSNGGGIRTSIKKGDITTENIINVNPFGNAICMVNLKGQDLLDMFEYFVSITRNVYKEDGKAVGELGAFEQISGLKITIDTSKKANLNIEIKDGEENLVSVGEGERRITQMDVLQSDGTYAPIDPLKTYKVASTNYFIKNGGCGMKYMMQNKEILVDEAIADYQSLIDFMNFLEGDFSKYATTEGRITVK